MEVRRSSLPPKINGNSVSPHDDGRSSRIANQAATATSYGTTVQDNGGQGVPRQQEVRIQLIVLLWNKLKWEFTHFFKQ
jgi:hypothetical protein